MMKFHCTAGNMLILLFEEKESSFSEFGGGASFTGQHKKKVKQLGQEICTEIVLSEKTLSLSP